MLDSGSLEDTVRSIPEGEVDAVECVKVGKLTGQTLLALTLEATAHGVLLDTVEHGPQIVADILMAARVEQHTAVDIRGFTPASNLASMGHLELLIIIETKLRPLLDAIRKGRNEAGDVLDGLCHTLGSEGHVTLLDATKIERLDHKAIGADQSEQASRHLERGRAIAGVGDEDLREDHRARGTRILNREVHILALEAQLVLLVVSTTLVGLGLDCASNAPAESIELLDHALRGHERVTVGHTLARLSGEDRGSDLRDIAVLEESNHAPIIASQG
jgi:hypothetical protein